MWMFRGSITITNKLTIIRTLQQLQRADVSQALSGASCKADRQYSSSGSLGRCGHHSVTYRHISDPFLECTNFLSVETKASITDYKPSMSFNERPAASQWRPFTNPTPMNVPIKSTDAAILIRVWTLALLRRSSLSHSVPFCLAKARRFRQMLDSR